MQPTRIDVRGSFLLSVPPIAAFPLFSPRGEMDWVDGWSPEFIHPPSGELEENQVFLTGADGVATIWSVVRLNAAAHEVEYLRVTPGSRSARVFVTAAAHEAGSRVEIRYLCTALSEEAARELSAFRDGFEDMLDEWQRLTSAHLESLP